MSQHKDRERERIPSYSTYYSIQAFRALEEAHPLWGGHSSLLSLQIKMLISCGNTLTETARNNVELNIWALCISVKLTRKTNHRTQEGSGKNKDNRENKNKDTRGNFQL